MMTEKEEDKIQKVNIWEFGGRVGIKVTEKFLLYVGKKVYFKYKSKSECYSKFIKPKFSLETFKDFLELNHNKKFFTPLNFWLELCDLLKVSFYELQRNILAYKTCKGPNFISNPILPVKIVPLFDMILAHNIGDGTVINPKKGRLPYFGYRQFDLFFRELYIKKLESIFGKINFPRKYYLETTRPYCPSVLSSLFFSLYDLNVESFLSKKARIPFQILEKDKEFLLGVLIAFIIDEGNIDSTAIVIGLKNVNLTDDLLKICKKLDYDVTLTKKGEYGYLFILREGMRRFFNDYKEIIQKYPDMSLGKMEEKIERGFRIYDRPIYKTKGNRNLIANLLKNESLTVNQIAQKINMTRQGVRFHVHCLEREGLIFKNGLVGERNIVYSYRGR